MLADSSSLAEVSHMQKPAKPSEFLLLSRGKWDPGRSPEEIQAAIDSFYVWHEQLVAEGKFKSGQRLSTEGKLVSSLGVIDGPFTETKEVIGGYWFIVADSLEEAAAIAARSPCLACGLSYEIRPVELERASAWRVSSETPTRTK
jgi:hypothetical protein